MIPTTRQRPIAAAFAAWQRISDSGEAGFAAMIGAFLRTGFVYAGDDAFILAQPQNGDTWWVHLAAGDLTRFLDLAPYPLPWVAWQRKGTGKVHVWSWENFRKHINRIKKATYGLIR